MPSAAEIVDASIGEHIVSSFRDRLILAAGKTATPDLPRASLVMLFSSRSGSTYAARLLENTEYFKAVREAFNPATLTIIREQLGLENDADAASMAVERYRTSRAFAAKCGVPGLSCAYLTGVLQPLIEHGHFIFVRRRDRAAQAVSLARAQMSGQFHSTQMPQRIVRASDYDRKRIDDAMEAIELSENALEHFANLLPGQVPEFWYEDICGAPNRFVDAALEHVGLPQVASLDLSIGIEKMRDEISEQWCTRYESGA